MARRFSRAPIAAVVTLGVLAVASASAGAPAAQVAAPIAVPARTIKVMTWNICGGNNSTCQFYRQPGTLVGTLRRQMRENGPADAAIFQEFCSSFAQPLERELEEHYGYGWDVRFVPIKIKKGDDPATAPTFQCNRGRGAYGIALAVPDENTWWQPRYLPSPEGEEWRVALCATVESWWVKLCNAHLSYSGDDPKEVFRTQQVPAYLSHVLPSRFRVIFGGDLNLRPTAPAIGPAYDSFVECAQATQASPRAGPGTAYSTRAHDNAKTIKIDYLFTNPDLPHTCAVPAGVVESSDHRPLWMTVTLPATTRG
jgi:endonuclease/exonuclease/phosphatase family metal-dependent hydrolase